MKVFDKSIKIKKKEDGSFLMSVAISDSTVIIKNISKKDIEMLFVDLEKLLFNNKVD